MTTAILSALPEEQAGLLQNLQHRNQQSQWKKPNRINQVF